MRLIKRSGTTSATSSKSPILCKLQGKATRVPQSTRLSTGETLTSYSSTSFVRLFIDISEFFKAFFGQVTNLTSMVEAVFKRCQKGKDPLYGNDGWRRRVRISGTLL